MRIIKKDQNNPSKNKKTICLLSMHGYVASNPRLGLADTGGQVVYVIELSKHLAKLGCQVDLYTRQLEKLPQQEFLAENARIIRIPCGNDEFIPKEKIYPYISEWVTGIIEYIATHHLHYHIINSHYCDSGLAGVELAKQLKIKHIHTPHSLGTFKRDSLIAQHRYTPDQLEFLYNFSKRIISEKAVYQNSQKIIATSPQQKQFIITDYGISSRKIKIIPPGYDTERFFPINESQKQILRKKLGFSKPFILALGRLTRNKGFDLLIEAFYHVYQENSDVLLVMALGADDHEGNLLIELKNSIERLKLTESVILIKPILGQTLVDYFHAADIFVMPSLSEPFGMVAIEAMGSGLPAVVSTNSGLAVMLKNKKHAYIVDVKNSLEFSAKIIKLINTPAERLKLASNGLSLARRQFSWNAIAEALLLLM